MFGAGHSLGGVVLQAYAMQNPTLWEAILMYGSWLDNTVAPDNVFPTPFFSLTGTLDGGGISLGHPVGASGARIVFHLLKVLERKQAHRGIASLCIGGGQGGAMLIERAA